MDSITIADGKYTVNNDNGKLTALRHGEPWNRDLTGDNLVYFMMAEILRLRECVEKVDAKALGGLCCFNHGGTREFLKDIRDEVADVLDKERPKR